MTKLQKKWKNLPKENSFMPKGDKSFFEFLKGDDFKTKDSLT
jgi:hypothetical protein